MEQILTSILYTFGDIDSYLSIAAFVALLIRKPSVRAFAGTTLVLTAVGQVIYLYGICAVHFWYFSSLGWFFKLLLLEFSPLFAAIAAIREGDWADVGLAALLLVWVSIQYKIGKNVSAKAAKQLGVRFESTR